MLFHEFLKNLRVMRDLGLREFAHKIGMDVGNYSRIERGIVKPPQKEETLIKISEVLQLDAENTEKLNMFVAIEYGKLFADLAEVVRGYEYLPVLLRTISSKRLSDEQLRDLTERINKEF